MKSWFINKLDRFAIWILKKTGGFEKLISYIINKTINEPKEVSVYIKRAEEMVKEINHIPQSGEFKRHQVYARLIKEFPEIPKKDLGLAIEIGVQKL